MQNDYLPRSVARCLDQVEECLGNLPNHKDTLKPVRDVYRRVSRINPARLNPVAWMVEVDRLQVGISGIHTQIRNTWFA